MTTRFVPLEHILTPDQLPEDRTQWKEAIYEKVHDIGYVILRGFDVHDKERFQTFLEDDLSVKSWNYFKRMKVRLKIMQPLIAWVRRLSLDIIGYNSRRNFVNEKLLQLACVENAVQGPHVESGIYNKRARYLFMHCEVAPQTWGETGIADLKTVYENLQPETRKTIHNAWQKFEITSVNPLNWIQRVLITLARIKHYRRPDNCMQLQMGYSPMVCQHPNSGALCPQIWSYRSADVQEIANQTFPERAPLDQDQMTSVVQQNWTPISRDGTPIENADSIHRELTQVTFDNAYLIKWQAGDMAMVDNIRCAHWRMNGVAEEPRKIFQLQSEPFFASDMAAP